MTRPRFQKNHANHANHALAVFAAEAAAKRLTTGLNVLSEISTTRPSAGFAAKRCPSGDSASE